MGDDPVPRFPQYDFAVLSSSWDERCLNVLKVDVHFDRCVMLVFDPQRCSDTCEKHGRELRNFANARSREVIEVIRQSEDVHDAWRSLRQALLTLPAATHRPLRVFIDLSAMPRFYSLASFALAFSGLAARTTVLYSEAEYPSEQTAIDRLEMFTTGRWETLPVPGLEGEFDPTKQRSWILTVGFEGAKTDRAVRKADPDRLAVVFPDPAFRPEYVPRTWDNNEALMTSIAPGRIVRAPAADAIATWRALSERSLEVPQEENVSYVCVGTKPHALAVAARALTLGYPTVIYAKPDGYKEATIRQAGPYWIYEFADLSMPDPGPFTA